MNIPDLNIFEFSDFRKFLEKYQNLRRAEDSSFARSQLCKELGLPNTRSYFNDIVKGTRNITVNYIERFVKILGMTQEEAQYFRILVYFDQSTYEQELRELLGSEMSLKPWRNTAIYEALNKRLCLDSHKWFLLQKSKT